MGSKIFLILLMCAVAITQLTISCKNTRASDNTPIGFTLPDLAGKSLSLSDYLGKKVVLIVFGATWCPHCRAEVPELKQIYEKFKEKDFALLYIDIGESQKKVSGFVKEQDIPYTVLLDEKNEVANSYKVYGIPYAMLIDRKGDIAFKGGAPEGFLPKKIEELLK